MKIYLFLFIPVLLFSQIPDYPDTLYLKSGQIYPCLITNIEEHMVKLYYKKNMSTSAGLNLVDKIFLEKFNIVFENEKYTSEFNKLEEFVSQRGINIKGEKNLALPSFINASAEYKFSFGVLFVPFINSEIRQVLIDPYYGYMATYILGRIETLFESQFTYSLSPRLRIQFDLGYGSSYIKEREEEHETNPYNSNDSGLEIINDMNIFNFNMGFKYFISDIIKNKVSAYFMVGLGKQFAFVDNKTEYLFPDPYYQRNYIDNESEFLEDLNSPFYANFGFGVEYFFNQSLSLNANMRLNYMAYSAEYKYNYTYQDYHQYRLEKIDFSEITKRVGLGLNFYF